MPLVITSADHSAGVGLARGYAAGHKLQWVDRAGVRTWLVTFPGRAPARFAAEADARFYAEQVQAESDRRERRRAGTRPFAA